VWNEARIINATANLLTVLAVLTLLGAALVWLVRLPAFDFKKIEIVSAPDTSFQYVAPDLIRSAIAGQLYGNFFTMNLGQARQAFETAAWVRQAQVRRVWPNMLRVTIEEQKPQGLWNENQLINTWGEVFTANRGALENEASLPQFQGPEGTGILIIQRYAELRQWFEQIGIQVRGLTLTNRYALQVTLSNGLTLELGRDPGAEAPDPQAGVPGAVTFGERIERFVRSWPKVMAQIPQREVTHVDLRYPDGFALTLAPLPEPTQPQKKR
jgi:cell division protein FtsQ